MRARAAENEPGNQVESEVEGMLDGLNHVSDPAERAQLLEAAVEKLNDALREDLES